MDSGIKLIFTEKDWNDLHGGLIQPDALERVAVALLGRNDIDNPSKLYVRKLLVFDDEYFISEEHNNSIFSRGRKMHNSHHCKLNLPGMQKMINLYNLGDVDGLIEVHSHPFSSQAAFSGFDDDKFGSLRKSILKRNKNNQGFFARMVLGKEEAGFTCYYSDPNDANREKEIKEISIFGEKGYRVLHKHNDIPSRVSMSERYLRNVEWLGEDRQASLQDKVIGIVGLGGGGFPFTLMAASAGFRHFILVDFDEIEEKNFNRLSGIKFTDTGRGKVEVVKEKLLLFDPTLDVKTCSKEFGSEEAQSLLRYADTLVGAVDEDSVRLSMQIFASQYMIPYFDIGCGIYLDESRRNILKKGNRIRVSIPGQPCLCCQGLNVNKIKSREQQQAEKLSGYITGTNDSPGSVVTLNTTGASMIVSLLIDYYTGINPIPQQIELDELKYEMKTRKFRSKSECKICGEENIFGTGYQGKFELPEGVEVLGSESQFEQLRAEDQLDNQDVVAESRNS